MSQSTKHGLDAHVPDPVPRRMDEHRRLCRSRRQHSTPFQVGAQGDDRRGMEHDLAGLATLGVDDDDHPVVQRYVVTVEADRLPDTHTRDREQADEGLVGGSRQWPAGTMGRLDKPLDVGIGVQIGGGPSERRQRSPIWHLGGWIDGLQPGSEAAHDAHAHAQPRRRRVVGHGDPRHGQLVRDPSGTGLLAECDELLEQQPLTGELEPERAANGKVVGEGCFQGVLAHGRLPGHGWARPASWPMSTFA